MTRTKRIISIGVAALAILQLGGCVVVNASDNSISVADQKTEKTLLKSSAEKLKEQPSGKYFSEPTHTSLTWRIGHMGMSQYTARFNKLSANLDFDSQNPTNSSVTAIIDPLSVSTGLVNFDKEIGEEFFLGKEISFKSTSLTQTGPVNGKLTGDLTFRGMTKSVTLDVTFNGGLVHPFAKVPAIGFSAHGFIKRSEFGLDKFIPMVTDDVEIFIETEFLKK